MDPKDYQERIAQEKANIKSATLSGKAKGKVVGAAVFWSQIASAIALVWARYLSPIASPFRFVFGGLFSLYVKAWTYFTEVDGQFSRQRGAGMVAFTVIFMYFAINILSFAVDVGLYFATRQIDEVVYLSNAQEIGPDENVFSVQGCEAGLSGSEFSCSEDESLYFRIDGTLFTQVWSLASRGGIFYPDYVAAPIAPGWQRCTVTSYGFRAKTMIRRWEIYPHLLSARCQEM